MDTLDMSSSLDDSEEIYRLVPYGCPPPTGFWHKKNNEEGEPIDYVPRGDSWYFSHGLGPPQRYYSGQSRNNSVHKQDSETLLKSLGSIHSVPIDHRLSLGTNLRGLQYLSNAVDFITKLQKNGGCYWIKDFDSHGNSKLYSLPPSKGGNKYRESQTTPMEYQLRCPEVKWPNPWHATLASEAKLQPLRPGAPSIKAPWRRLV
jgi:hypothetical protein